MQGVSPQTGVDKLLLLAKKVQQDLQAQCPHLHQSILIYPIPNIRIPFLPHQCPLFNLHCNSATHMMRFLGLVFSNLSSAATRVKYLFQERHRRFQSFIQCLSWEFESLNSFFPPLYSVTLGATTNLIILISLTEMFEGVTYMVIQFLDSYKCLRISSGNFAYFYFRIMSQTISLLLLSLLLETESLVSLNLIISESQF